MPRPVKRPARVRPPARRRAAPAAAPSPPKLTEAQRRQALAAAFEAGARLAWAAPPQSLGSTGGVERLAGPVTRGRPHWLLVTRGLAARGFELALRVVRHRDEAAPPAWATALLGTLVERVLAESLTPDAHQCLLLAEGVAPGSGSELGALAFTADPAWPALQTPSASVPVLLAVPVTGDEARVVREWSPVGLLELLAKVDPLLVTDLERPSLLSSPRARALIEQRVDSEGSSLSTLTAQKSRVVRAGDTVTWTLSKEAVDSVVSLLKGRTGHLRPFSVVSGPSVVEVVNAEAPRVELKAQALTLGVSLVAARQLRAQLKARPGTYQVELLPNFTVAVV